MTRMWMGAPSTMCRQHLLGEHKEIHQLLGQLMKGMSLSGYVRNDCIEITSIAARHDALVAEMIKRGYKHLSPMLGQDEINRISAYLPEHERLHKVNVLASNEDRFHRCDECCNLGKINWRVLP